MNDETSWQVSALLSGAQHHQMQCGEDPDTVGISKRSRISGADVAEALPYATLVWGDDLGPRAFKLCSPRFTSVFEA